MNSAKVPLLLLIFVFMESLPVANLKSKNFPGNKEGFGVQVEQIVPIASNIHIIFRNNIFDTFKPCF